MSQIKCPLKILHVVGARPNFMKVAPLIRAMSVHPEVFSQTLVHTGQHYDYNMSQVFFQDLALPEPDTYLSVGSGTHAEQTARTMTAFEKVILASQPDWVIVVGDVNSTLACALTASKMNVKVAHIEAGLRSFDRTMPEEINRILTDHLADLLFTSEPSANENLSREGISAAKIHFVGNVMIDSLMSVLPHTENRRILDALCLRSVDNQEIHPFVLVTLHRPSNVDNSSSLTEIIQALNELATSVPVIFPVHPRTRQRLLNLPSSPLASGLRLLEPLGYADFLALMRFARLVISDSGGIQEETTFLGVPCLTIRPNTERPITIQFGTNCLVESQCESILRAAGDILNQHTSQTCRTPRVLDLWDGKASQRVVKVFCQMIGND